MKKIAIAIMLLFCAIQSFAQLGIGTSGSCYYGKIPLCTDSQTISASGNAVRVESNGGLYVTFELKVTGSPSTLSVVTAGCATGGTCTTLNTYTGTSDTTISIVPTNVYAYYTNTATWTGGTNPTVKVNTAMTTSLSYAGVVPNGKGGIKSADFDDLSVRNTNVPGSYAPGLYGFGHSIMVGCCASATGDGTYTGYAYKLRDYIGGVYSNRGISGAQTSEIMQFQIQATALRYTPNLSNNPISLVDVGTNDATKYGTDPDKQDVYKGGLRTVLTWLAIPSVSGNRAAPALADYRFWGWSTATASSGCTRSGAEWTSVQDGGTKSSTQGSTLTCKIVTYGGPIFVTRYMADSTAATCNLTIDGVSRGDFSSAGTNGAAVLTLNSHAYTWYTDAFAVAAGTHTLVFTITSNNADTFNVVEILTPPPSTLPKYPGAPRVYLHGVYKQYNDANSDLTAAYDAINKAMVAEMRGYGLNVTFVNVRDYLNTTTDMNTNDVHPVQAGHDKILLADLAAIQPATRVSDTQSLYNLTGGHADWKKIENLITLSTTGTTTDSADNLLPANSMIGPVSCVVNTTITTAANWSVGTSGSATQFCAAQTGLTTGTGVACGAHIGTTAMWNAADAKLRITTNVNPGAGKVRCIVYYLQLTAPGS